MEAWSSRRPPSAEIRLLVDALSGADDVRREAAAARLPVIGARAVERLLAAYERARRRRCASRSCACSNRSRMRGRSTSARRALNEGGEVGIAAAQVLRGLLDAREPGVATGALDALVAVALDSDAPRPLRRAALDMLRDLPEDMRAGVAGVLEPDADLTDDAVIESPRQAVKSAWSAALEGRLPERPSELREAVQSRAAEAPLTALQKLVDALRARESADVAQAAEWRALRGSVHQALAVRGSRVALYDLKESLSEARTPLPVSFLSALHTVGDSSCLEPLAQAYAHAATPEEWWRQQLASAFRAVMAREKLTRRSAVVKRVLAKWPGAGALVKP